MQLFYISPSVLPSRSANSIHVVQQCEAFDRLGIQTTLFAKRSIPDVSSTIEAIHRNYGVKFKNTRLISYYNRTSLAENIGICLQAMYHLIPRKKNSVILSRNLYASFLLANATRRPLIFETHQLEHGFKRYLQYHTMIQPHVTTIVISQRLLDVLTKHHGHPPAKALVLHDAAPEGIKPLTQKSKHSVWEQLIPDIELYTSKAVVGYFGHLYSGRGLRIINKLAQKHPQITFLVIGGNAIDVDIHKKKNQLPNLIFIGYMPHTITQKCMAACDVLLMPYQRNVSIGVKGHDTANWMSPMKMFEYLASGTPIISSDLPSLREVLKDGENALLVPPDNVKSWSFALDRLIKNAALAEKIGRNGHKSYADHHTWTKRASAILNTVAP